MPPSTTLHYAVRYGCLPSPPTPSCSARVDVVGVDGRGASRPNNLWRAQFFTDYSCTFGAPPEHCWPGLGARTSGFDRGAPLYTYMTSVYHRRWYRAALWGSACFRQAAFGELVGQEPQTVPVPSPEIACQTLFRYLANGVKFSRLCVVFFSRWFLPLKTRV